MNFRLSYRRMLPIDMYRDGPKSGFGSMLCGKFRESLQVFDESAMEAFVRLEPNTDEDEIEKFTEKYGLLRWNWTHEGQGGSKSDQFVMPLAGFKESLEQFQLKWIDARNRRTLSEIIGWLSEQLEKDSAVDDVDTADEMWKLSQSRVSLSISAGDGWRASTYLY